MRSEFCNRIAHIELFNKSKFALVPISRCHQIRNIFDELPEIIGTPMGVKIDFDEKQNKKKIISLLPLYFRRIIQN